MIPTRREVAFVALATAPLLTAALLYAFGVVWLMDTVAAWLGWIALPVTAVLGGAAGLLMPAYMQWMADRYDPWETHQ